MLGFQTTARMVTRTCAILKAEYMQLFDQYQKPSAVSKRR